MFKNTNICMIKYFHADAIFLNSSEIEKESRDEAVKFSREFFGRSVVIK